MVNENDTTATDEITFGDNDFLAAQVAIMLEARLLVLLTDTAGLHTADPRNNPDAELISEVADPAELESYEIGEHTSPFGLGGMRSKSRAAEMAGAAGIPAVICDGTSEGTLLAAVAGEPVGTRFAPHAEKASSFKLWLRYAKPTHGTLAVDDGAARVLRESGQQPAARRHHRGRGRVRAGRRGRDPPRGRRRPRDRQGGRQLLLVRARPDQGHAHAPRSGSCCRTPPRRPCTGTTSS